MIHRTVLETELPAEKKQSRAGPQIAGRDDGAEVVGFGRSKAVAVDPVERGLDDERGAEPVVQAYRSFLVIQKRRSDRRADVRQLGGQLVVLHGYLPVAAQPAGRLDVRPANPT